MAAPAEPVESETKTADPEVGHVQWSCFSCSCGRYDFHLEHISSSSIVLFSHLLRLISRNN